MSIWSNSCPHGYAIWLSGDQDGWYTPYAIECPLCLDRPTGSSFKYMYERNSSGRLEVVSDDEETQDENGL